MLLSRASNTGFPGHPIFLMPFRDSSLINSGRIILPSFVPGMADPATFGYLFNFTLELLLGNCSEGARGKRDDGHI
jgi:hypothetical protein